MLKIGRAFGTLSTLLLILALPISGIAANIIAEVDRDTILESESVRLIVTIQNSDNSDIEDVNISAPNFEIGNRFNSFSTQSIFANGKFEFQRSLSTTFILFPKSSGKFKITNIRAKIGNKELTAPTVDITVEPDSDGNNRGRGQNTNNQNGAFKLPQPVANNKRSFFLQTVLSKPKAYIGEQVTASYYIVHKTPISDPFLQKVPSFEGFWREELELTKQMRPTPTIINGMRFFRAFLAKYALFPLKTGKISIEPMELAFKYRSASPLDDDIFGSMFQITQMQPGNARSDVLEMDIIDVPSEGKPSSFISGAVGQFQLEISPSGSFHAEVDKPFSLKYRFSGKGNAAAFPDFKPSLPSSFETFDPKVSKQIAEDQSWKEVELLVFPRQPGTFDLPLGEFSYFDPIEKRYVTIPQKTLHLEVTGTSNHPTKTDQSTPTQKQASTPGQGGQKSPKFYWGTLWSIIASLIWLLFIAKSSFDVFLGKRKDHLSKNKTQLFTRLKNLKNLSHDQIAGEAFRLTDDILKQIVPDQLTMNERLEKAQVPKRLKDIIQQIEMSRFSGTLGNARIDVSHIQEDLKPMIERLDS